MNDMAEIKANADRLVELTNQQSVIKAEIDEIKAWFEKIATDDLKDTKKKTIDYWGSNNSKVVVGNSETVKPVSMTMVKKFQILHELAAVRQSGQEVMLGCRFHDRTCLLQLL